MRMNWNGVADEPRQLPLVADEVLSRLLGVCTIHHSNMLILYSVYLPRKVGWAELALVADEVPSQSKTHL